MTSTRQPLSLCSRISISTKFQKKTIKVIEIHFLKIFVVHTSDAIHLMNSMKKDNIYFDVIDLDPYGSAIPFLESSLQVTGDGGLLCVTFTDMAVLCARQPHVCFYKYGALPLPKKYCHEVRSNISFAIRWH